MLNTSIGDIWAPSSELFEKFWGVGSLTKSGKIFSEAYLRKQKIDRLDWFSYKVSPF